MKITKITKKNAGSFLPLLPDFVTNESGMLCLGTVDDEGRAAAALSARVDFEVIYIISLYVVPECRRKGYASGLIETLISLTKDLSYRAVSVYFPPNEAAAAFFRSRGFEIVEGMPVYSVPIAELIRQPRVKKYVLNSKTNGIKYLSELNESEKKELSGFLRENGMPGGGFYDPEWSTAVFTNDKVESLLLMDVTDDCIRMLYLKLDEKDLKAVTRHLRALVDKALSDEEHSGGLSLRFVQTFFKPIIALTGNERYIRHLGRGLHGVRLL